ncbi:hypothetical protein H4I96_10632 [Botrytis cinerea]
MVCGPPNLIKKDIHVYSDCDDCLLGAPIREERRKRLAKKASERWMTIVDDVINDGDEHGEGVEEIRLEFADERAGMKERVKFMMAKNKHKYQEENEDEDARLLAAQEAIQSELENSEGAPDEDDDMAAAAQLLSALRQELGKGNMDSKDADIDQSDEGKEEGDDGESQEHVQAIMENLGKLRERSEKVEVDSMLAEQEDCGM